jgi:phage N-6-adenine-methyltransferase
MARIDKQFSSEKVEWEPPLDLFDPLNDEFGFTLDVAADSTNAKCEKYLTLSDDVLNTPWSGVCWCNPPPYGRDLAKWVRKGCVETWNGVTSVFLIPVRSNTRWWHDLCIPFGEIRFVIGRPKFGGADQRLPWPLAIIVFRGKPILQNVKGQTTAKPLSVPPCSSGFLSFVGAS